MNSFWVSAKNIETWELCAEVCPLIVMALQTSGHLLIDFLADVLQQHWACWSTSLSCSYDVIISAVKKIVTEVL